MKNDEPVQSGDSNNNIIVNNEISNESIFDLGESLTIKEVNDAVGRFLSLVDVTDSINLSADNLNRIDGAGIQFVCEIFKQEKIQHYEVVWLGESEVINAAASKMGVQGDLRLPVNV